MSKRIELEALGEEIAEQAAHLDAAMHRLLTNIRRFDQDGGWVYQSASSCAHWLSWRIGLGFSAARQYVRVANKLGGLPVIDEALRRGEVSFSKVRAITRVATPATEEVLLGFAQHMSGAQLEQTCRKFAVVQKQEEPTNPKDEALRRYVSRRGLEDGMVKIEAVLHADEAALVWSLLDRVAAEATRAPRAEEISQGDSAEPSKARDVEYFADSTETTTIVNPRDSVTAMDTSSTSNDVDGSAEPSNVHDLAGFDTSMDAIRNASNLAATTSECALVVTPKPPDASGAQPSRRMRPTQFDRADALMAIMQAHARGNQPDRAPIELVVTVSANALRRDTHVEEMDRAAVLSDGTCISVEAARRLACDAGVVEIVEDEKGKPLSVGRMRRSFPAAIIRALNRRDPCCQFPGCQNRIFVQAHHIDHWIDGGETSLENAINLCSFHHRCLHEHNFSVVRGAESQTYHFFDDQMRPIQVVPTVTPRADRGWPAIETANEYLQLTPEVAACRWDGDPIDYSLVIDTLCRLEDRTREP